MADCYKVCSSSSAFASSRPAFGIRRSTLASKLLRCKSGKIFVLWSWGTLKALRTIISYWVDARIDWRIIIIIITIQLLSEAFKIGYAADENVS